ARPAAQTSGRSSGMREATGEQQEPAAAEAGSQVYSEYNTGGGKPCEWKKFVYVEPPKRVKEVLEEELCFRRDDCHIKHPAAVALEGIWSVKRNFAMGGLKPVLQNRNSLLTQPKFYSRHEGIRSKNQLSFAFTETYSLQHKC
uniref:Chromosome 11 open reading frame 97 n=1 Tax=Sphenodon punctatus TaxID=8508 RepID=A0A8D0L389_SPHPU